MSKFLHADYDNDYAKAIAIPWSFPENRRATNDLNNQNCLTCSLSVILMYSNIYMKVNAARSRVCRWLINSDFQENQTTNHSM